jgi:hypothetical protein
VSAHQVVLIAHLLGLAFGMGGAVTIDAILLIAALRRRVTPELVEVIHVASGMVAAAMIVLAVSGAAFFLTGSQPSPKFWAKMVIVGVACLNGLAAHRLVFPLIESGVVPGQGRLRLRRRGARLAAASAAVSGVSWFGALVLGAWKGCPFGMAPLLAGYGVALTGGALFSALVVAPRIFVVAPARRRGRERPVKALRQLLVSSVQSLALTISDGALAVAARLGDPVSPDDAGVFVAPAHASPANLLSPLEPRRRPRPAPRHRLPDELLGNGWPPQLDPARPR